MAIGTALRMAGPKLFQFLTKGIPKDQLILRVGSDALNAGMSAYYTPGDIGDKLIAGLTDAGLSSIGGLAAGRIGNPAFRSGVGGFATDYVGSVAGMELGRAVGDQLQRGKDVLMGGEGLTGYERLGAEERKQFEQDVRQQVLAQYGLLPGAGARPEYYGADPYLAQLGLG